MIQLDPYQDIFNQSLNKMQAQLSSVMDPAVFAELLHREQHSRNRPFMVKWLRTRWDEIQGVAALASGVNSGISTVPGPPSAPPAATIATMPTVPVPPTVPTIPVVPVPPVVIPPLPPVPPAGASLVPLPLRAGAVPPGTFQVIPRPPAYARVAPDPVTGIRNIG